MRTVVRQLRRAALLHAGDRAGDGELLEAFVNRRDEAAFELLLRRHGPMVLGVCRRVLRHTQDAEDAFQATFLVLARKAASVRPRDRVGPWLYGVAYRTALKARAMSAKRRIRERQAGEQSRPRGAGEPSADLLGELDAALSRLPARYRVPLVLCELQGLSRKEAARTLALPEGTLSWRLAHARKLLARKLLPAGGVSAVGALSEVLARPALSAGVPPPLLVKTTRAVFRAMAGEALTAGLVSARVVILTEGVMKAMLLNKLKNLGAIALAVLLGAGALGLTYQTAGAQPTGPGATTPAARATADELEELRLEVAALRKGLQATRERVKALEGEVQVLQAAHTASEDRVRRGMAAKALDANNALMQQQWADWLAGRRELKEWVTEPQASNPLTVTETALKSLRQNPDDKQAIEALERALRWLRERQKRHDMPTTTGGPPKNPPPK
jgi:RNA polymerase sigma factor (sigma-70 family)